MQKVKNYKIWSRLSDEEKEQEYLQWDTYACEGQDILKEAVKELQNQYKSNKSILEISGGLYQGGLLVINIHLKRGAKVKLPPRYKGFTVMRSYRRE